MDFGQNNNHTEPLTHNMAPSTPPAVKTPRKSNGWRIFWGITLTLSVLANITLLLMLIGLVAIFIAGQESMLTEEVIQSGPRTSKIAIITINGIIDGEKAQDIYAQLSKAADDRQVKGLIIRVNSPGGTISASDQICNEIRKYRRNESKPVVAFMQGVAASGGYYVSVPCDKIVAEPTAITGSVGVIAGHFVLQQLLEEKLGIQPAVFKSGEKKDWPSPFQPVTEEQRKYIQDKLIDPAYNRFVQVINEERDALTIDDVKRLADGSIFCAEEALKEKLIDEIGYLDDAVERVKVLAGIERAHLVEYQRPFSFSDLLRSQSRSMVKFDSSTLYELSTPQVLYLWTY